MDAKSINFTARQSLGFFITQKADTEQGRTDFEAFEKVAKFATDALRERKIRPANVSLHFGELGTLINDVADYAVTVGLAEERVHGYSASVVFAALARYSTLMERKMLKN